jgi:hypothetical protein
MTNAAHRVAPGVAHVRTDRDGRTVIHLAVLPDGPFVELDGSAALIWEAALTAEPDLLVATVAAAGGVRPEAIEDQVHGFVAELRDRGLLAAPDAATLD